MNIFDLYLEKILKVVKQANKDKLIEVPENLKGINVDIPPPQFNCDISTNVSMVLAKINSTKPVDLANRLSVLIKQNDTKIVFCSPKTIGRVF